MLDKHIVENASDAEVKAAVEELIDKGYYERQEDGSLEPTEDGIEWLKDSMADDDDRVLESFQDRIAMEVDDGKDVGPAISVAAEWIRDNLERNPIAILESQDFRFPDGSSLDLEKMLDDDFEEVKETFEP